MFDGKPFDGFQWLAHSHAPVLHLCIIYIQVTAINYLGRVKPTFNNQDDLRATSEQFCKVYYHQILSVDQTVKQ